MKSEASQSVQTVTHGNVTLKIYEFHRNDKTVYSVAHREGTRRKLKQFRDLGQALTWASNRAKEINQGKSPSVFLSTDEGITYRKAKDIIAGSGKGLDEVAKEYIEARNILGYTVRLTDAVEFYAQRRLNVTQRTVPEVVAELLESRDHKSDRYLDDLRLRLGRFAREMTGYIANITQRDLSAWLRGLGLSARSHDNFRRTIVTLFKFAQKSGYLPEGRTEAEKTERMGDDGEGEIEVFTPDEMRRLLNAAYDDVIPFLTLGGFAGVRSAEILRMCWEEINLKTGYIEIKKSKAKTKGRRLIPMQPNLVAWLKRLAKPSGPITSLARPDIAAADVVAPKCDPYVTWKRNGLRHSYCSYRYAILQNEHQVSAEMGNSPAMIFQNYRALATKEQANAWFNIFPEKGKK